MHQQPDIDPTAAEAPARPGHSPAPPIVGDLLRCLATGALIAVAIGCAVLSLPPGTVIPCEGDAECPLNKLCTPSGVCEPGCRPESPHCAPGKECVPVDEEGYRCAPKSCDEPAICEQGSVCWPPPPDPDGSWCTPLVSCGGSTTETPACASGSCLDGNVCDLIEVSDGVGGTTQICGCVPL